MLVFVYGTLKRGYGNYDRLLHGRSRYVCDGVTVDRFRLLNLGYFPMVVAGDDGHVVGEVFDVGPQVVADLDRLEGEGTFYHRRLIFVRVPSLKDPVLCATYIGAEGRGNGARAIEPVDGEVAWHRF